MDYGKKPAALQILDIGSKMLSYIIPPDSIILSNATYQNGEGSLSKVLCFFVFLFLFHIDDDPGPWSIISTKKRHINLESVVGAQITTSNRQVKIHLGTITVYMV